jgi:hypothetical protein
MTFRETDGEGISVGVIWISSRAPRENVYLSGSPNIGCRVL